MVVDEKTRPERSNPKARELTILSFLRQSCIPIQHGTAGNGFADLQPLKQLLADIKVVGLGEATHGTREFFQFKHRLVEFLVTEMGFNAFGLESSTAACQMINQYILSGSGDRASALTGQGYIAWDTEEFTELLEWLRDFNQHVPDRKKVQFYGLDIHWNSAGREAVLRFLQIADPGQLPSAQMLFEEIAKTETRWPGLSDEKARLLLFPRLNELIDIFHQNVDDYMGRTSLEEFIQALHLLEVMKQEFIANVADLQPPSQRKATFRSKFMADNLIAIIDQGGPEKKFLFWAHNYHVSKGEEKPEEMRAGYILRQKLGRAYFAFGFDFNQGAFLTRTMSLDQVPGPLTRFELPPAPAGSFPNYLSRASSGMAIFNLRGPVENPAVREWLSAPQIVHSANWVLDEAAQYYPECLLLQNYDGIVFFNETHAAHPNSNTEKSIADLEGRYL